MKIPFQHITALRDDIEKINDLIYDVNNLLNTVEAMNSSSLRSLYVVSDRALKRAKNAIREIIRRY